MDLSNTPLLTIRTDYIRFLPSNYLCYQHECAGVLKRRTCFEKTVGAEGRGSIVAFMRVRAVKNIVLTRSPGPQPQTGSESLPAAAISQNKSLSSAPQHTRIANKGTYALYFENYGNTPGNPSGLSPEVGRVRGTEDTPGAGSMALDHLKPESAQKAA